MVDGAGHDNTRGAEDLFVGELSGGQEVGADLGEVGSVKGGEPPRDPSIGWVYWGDFTMWALTQKQRRALQLGRITPREARILYDITVLEANAFWRRVQRGEVAIGGQVGA